jgi:hypothetical protein
MNIRLKESTKSAIRNTDTIRDKKFHSRILSTIVAPVFQKIDQ